MVQNKEVSRIMIDEIEQVNEYKVKIEQRDLHSRNSRPLKRTNKYDRGSGFYHRLCKVHEKFINN